mmetsp:Transcript_62035/g.189445  ORF Transcript_62035/g.189445 Transcript_62035/m.189445 type:complete len:412 (-) Transcript_62035:133-1368(-)
MRGLRNRRGLRARAVHVEGRLPAGVPHLRGRGGVRAERRVHVEGRVPGGVRRLRLRGHVQAHDQVCMEARQVPGGLLDLRPERLRSARPLHLERRGLPGQLLDALLRGLVRRARPLHVEGRQMHARVQHLPDEGRLSRGHRLHLGPASGRDRRRLRARPVLLARRGLQEHEVLQLHAGGCRHGLLRQGRVLRHVQADLRRREGLVVPRPREPLALRAGLRLGGPVLRPRAAVLQHRLQLHGQGRRVHRLRAVGEEEHVVCEEGALAAWLEGHFRRGQPDGVLCAGGRRGRAGGRHLALLLHGVPPRVAGGGLVDAGPEEQGAHPRVRRTRLVPLLEHPEEQVGYRREDPHEHGRLYRGVGAGEGAGHLPAARVDGQGRRGRGPGACAAEAAHRRPAAAGRPRHLPEEQRHG